MCLTQGWQRPATAKFLADCTEAIISDLGRDASLQRRTSTKAIEQAYPHIIEMIVPLGGFGKKLDAMYEWHWARDIEAMRGCGWRDKSGRYYVRWCFFNLITAQDFARKFGGSIVKGR
jgi:hypothetical protein